MTDAAPPYLDVAANRRTSSWTRRERAGRLLWALAGPVFALSPRPAWGWRRALLRLFGARIGQGVHVYPSVRIAIPWMLEIGDEAAVGDAAILYSLGPLRIGARSTVSQGAHLCAGTHDLGRPDRPLVRAPIRIGRDAWVCADAFVGPGVNLGDGSILGARAVAVRDIPARTTAAGNPARIVRRHM
ncbi:MAG: acetyltransferase [Pseudomonadota bacterium]